MIQIGSKIRHIKRGSDYLVIAVARTIGAFEDQDAAVVYLQRSTASDLVLAQFRPMYGVSFAMPVSVQVSLRPYMADDQYVWVYQGEHGTYARPQEEFTPDRFEVLTSSSVI